MKKFQKFMSSVLVAILASMVTLALYQQPAPVQRQSKLDQLEQLILDNCSEDRTAEIVRKYPSAVLHTGKIKKFLNHKSQSLCFVNYYINTFIENFRVITHIF